jgi:hypothetical protein
VSEVDDLLDRAARMPYGEARTMLVEEALRHAEGDDALSFEVRRHLIETYRYGGEPAKMLTTFARCLADYDAAPGRCGPSADVYVRWYYKWAIGLLTDYPEVGLPRTYAALDDMERRYREGGHSLQAVYHHRNVVACHVGDRDAADEWFVRWTTAPRDDNSDCAGCDPSGQVRYLAWRGRDEDAIALAAPVLKGELSCREQPQSILTNLLLAYARTGRLDEARHAHRRAYRAVRTELADLTSVATHVEFCARTGNDARGLEIVERHLGWLDTAGTPDDCMQFASAAALVLNRLLRAGRGGVRLRRPAHGDRAAGEVEAAALEHELRTLALGLASAFDTRNGSSEQGDRVAARLAAEPLVEHLPLTALGETGAAEDATRLRDCLQPE